jgi:Cdc6-like AAA superfamily ATPase
MKSAFGKLEQTVNGLETIEEIKQKCVISMSGIIEVFDSKKGLKVKDTLKSLPRQDIIVLDSICNLFDLTGEEKILAIDQVFHQV